MKRLMICLSVLIIISLSKSVQAQYWVEFEPGTCVVGPPPTCVSGHWYWVEVPKTPVSSSEQFRRQLTKKRTSRKEISRFPTEMSTDLEYETISYGDVKGTSIGIRALYEREVKTNILLGIRGTYTSTTNKSESTLYDTDDVKSNIISVKGYLTGYLSEIIYVSGGYFFSNYKTDGIDDALKSTGPFVSAGVSTYVGALHLGGGLSWSNTSATLGDAMDESDSSISYGINTGLLLGQSAYLSGELFLLKDGLSVIGVSLFKMMSETFGLTLGYKTLKGIEDFSNSKITLGSSIRF